jgi:hypothetical protein
MDDPRHHDKFGQAAPPGEKFQRARKRVRDALAEDGIGGDIEKLVEKLLGPV